MAPHAGAVMSVCVRRGMAAMPRPQGDLVMKNLARLLVLLCAAILPLAARADQPGPHPHYLHALSDLREARAHIERRGGDPAMRWDEAGAVAEINAAIREIKEASIDDGKDLNFHPPVDSKLDRPGRLHRGLELLRSAHHDVEKEESNDFARHLRDRTLKHLDAAIHFVEQGIAESRH